MREPWKPVIVGLCGVAYAGKTTAAEFLSTNAGFRRLRFTKRMRDIYHATGLKDYEIDGYRKDKPCDLLGGNTPREYMLEVGRVLRAMDPEFLPKAWKADLDELLKVIPINSRRVVTDDVRTPAEAKAIHDVGGIIIRLVPGYKPVGPRPPPLDDPATEGQTFDVDEIIPNDGTVTELCARIKAALYVRSLI